MNYRMHANKHSRKREAARVVAPGVLFAALLAALALRVLWPESFPLSAHVSLDRRSLAAEACIFCISGRLALDPGWVAFPLRWLVCTEGQAAAF